MKSARLLLFALLAAAQLAVPAYMIARQQITLREGRVFKLRTAPVDPYDAFRGRYVALRFDAGSLPSTEPWKQGQRAFAILGEGGDGFAKVERLVAEPAPGANDAIPVTIGWANRLNFPFERYYLEESVAPQAEKAYQTANRRESQNAWVTIRVRDAYAALEELFIEGKPIRDFVRDNPPK